MENCCYARTPMNVNEKLQQDDISGKSDEKSFRSLVGGLIYLTHTRSNIMFAVSLVSRFMQSPTNHHFGAAKRILKYIAGIAELGIMYTRMEEFRLFGYCDSSYADDVDDRKSTSEFCISFGSSIVSWSSKKQATVSLSSIDQSMLLRLLQDVRLFG